MLASYALADGWKADLPIFFLALRASVKFALRMPTLNPDLQKN
jgi:hypothetical protein